MPRRVVGSSWHSVAAVLLVSAVASCAQLPDTASRNGRHHRNINSSDSEPEYEHNTSLSGDDSAAQYDEDGGFIAADGESGDDRARG